jgi:hypothetical protein
MINKRAAMNITWVICCTLFIFGLYQNCAPKKGDSSDNSTGVDLVRGDCSDSSVLGFWDSNHHSGHYLQFNEDCTGYLSTCDAHFSVPEGSMLEDSGDFPIRVATTNNSPGCETEGFNDCTYQIQNYGGRVFVARCVGPNGTDFYQQEDS